MSAASAKTHEPSMEEILASIRRIIADDQDTGRTEGGAQPAPDARGEEVDAGSAETGDVEPDTSDVAPADAAEWQPELADLDLGVPDILFAQVPPEPERPAPVAPEPLNVAAAAPPPQVWPAPRPSAPPRDEPLISGEATANIGTAFSMLSQTVLSQNARTLEDLVQDLLKPMLKTWLDDNLPPLVERLVRAEIERVARGRR